MGTDISQHIEIIKDEIMFVNYEYRRPSVLFKPALSVDGNQFCALYGENLQEGIAGFGDTANEAMRDFDKNWNALNIKGLSV